MGTFQSRAAENGIVLFVNVEDDWFHEQVSVTSVPVHQLQDEDLPEPHTYLNVEDQPLPALDTREFEVTGMLIGANIRTEYFEIQIDEERVVQCSEQIHVEELQI